MGIVDLTPKAIVLKNKMLLMVKTLVVEYLPLRRGGGGGGGNVMICIY